MRANTFRGFAFPAVVVSTCLAALVVTACGDDSGTSATIVPAGQRDASVVPSSDGGGASDAARDGTTGESDAEGRDAADVGAEVAAYTAGLAKAICGRLAACCASSDRDTFFGRYLKVDGSPFTLDATPTNAACEATLTAQLSIVHTKWAASVARGAMTFDATRATACVASLGAAACGLPLTQALAADSPCLDTRRGDVWKRVAKVGDTCQLLGDGVAFYSECAQEGGFCETFDASGKPQPTGTCKAWSKAGEACGVKQGQPKALCAPGLSCSNPSGGKCEVNAPDKPPAQKIGDTCSFPDYSIAECPAGSYCDTFGSRTCVAAKADGQACQFSDECPTPHWASCARGTCNSAGFCNGVLTNGDAGSDAASDGAADGGPRDAGGG